MFSSFKMQFSPEQYNNLKYFCEKKLKMKIWYPDENIMHPSWIQELAVIADELEL